MRAYPHGMFMSQRPTPQHVTQEQIESFLAKSERVNCDKINANISKAQCGRNYLKAIEVSGLHEYDSKIVYRKPCFGCKTGKANAGGQELSIRKCSSCGRPISLKMMPKAQRESSICMACSGNKKRGESMKSRAVLREM